MKILEDFRAIIVGFICAISFNLYLEHKDSTMGFTIIFIVFSAWLMLVIWNQKEKLKQNPPLPDWPTGEDAMRYYNLSHDILMQYVRKGLPVYPAGDEVLIFGDEVPPMEEGELAFEVENGDYSKYRFKKTEIEKFIKK